MGDYMASTESLRIAWMEWRVTHGASPSAAGLGAENAAFDRWLAAHDATVRADHEKAVRERIAQAIQVAADAAWTGTPRNAYLDAVRIAREAGRA